MDIAKRLNAIQEGKRKLLDNTMMLYPSSMLTDHHYEKELPVMLMGSGGGQIQGGRVLSNKDDPNRQVGRLYLSLMNKMGVSLDRFGDVNQPLAEI